MNAVTARLRSHDRGARIRGALFYALLVFSVAIGFLTLGALLVDVMLKGLNWTGATVDKVLLLEAPSADPALAGARPAILATIYLGVLLILFTVPLGVGTAIYLEEYANRDRWYNRLLEVNIQNLAAVPAIVYGILGLAFLVRGVGLGRVLLSGALILTLVVLPTVIIAAREAIRAVPDSIRQGAYARRRCSSWARSPTCPSIRHYSATSRRSPSRSSSGCSARRRSSVSRSPRRRSSCSSRSC